MCVLLIAIRGCKVNLQGLEGNSAMSGSDRS